jgi:hypothetical protein
MAKIITNKYEIFEIFPSYSGISQTINRLYESIRDRKINNL